MAPRLTITHRQLVALERAIRSMNLVGGRISVTGESDLLSLDEMQDLQQRLAGAVREEPDVTVKIDW